MLSRGQVEILLLSANTPVLGWRGVTLGSEEGKLTGRLGIYNSEEECADLEFSPKKRWLRVI